MYAKCDDCSSYRSQSGLDPACAACRSNPGCGQPRQRTYTRRGPSAPGLREAQRLGEMPERRRAQARQDPAEVGVVRDLPGLGDETVPRRLRKPRQRPAVALRLDQCLHHGTSLGGNQVANALAVRRHERVEIDDPPDPFRNAVGHACDDGARGAVGDQHDVVEVLEDQRVDHVVDVRREPHLGAGQVRALAEARERRCVTRAPASPSSDFTFHQHQPPNQAGWTRT